MITVNVVCFYHNNGKTNNGIECKKYVCGLVKVSYTPSSDFTPYFQTTFNTSQLIKQLELCGSRIYISKRGTEKNNISKKTSFFLSYE